MTKKIQYMESYVLSLTYSELLLDECERLAKQYKQIPWYSRWFLGKANLDRREKLLDHVEAIQDFRKWFEGDSAGLDVLSYTEVIRDRLAESA